jgi:hypothetical protein
MAAFVLQPAELPAAPGRSIAVSSYLKDAAANG